MRRLVGRLLLLTAGAAAAYWAWSKRGDWGDRPRPQPHPDPEPDVVDHEPVAEDTDEADEEEAQPEPEPEPEADREPDAAEADNRAPEPLDDEVDNRPPEPVEVDGQELAAPDVLVAWVNAATEEALYEAGVTVSARKIILANRPFTSAEELGDTRGIGPKTLEALTEAAR